MKLDLSDLRRISRHSLSDPFLRRKVWSGQIVATDEDLLLWEQKVEELIFYFLQEDDDRKLKWTTSVLCWREPICLAGSQ